MSKNIFKKTAQLLEKHISRILEAKQSFSFDAYLNQSLWIQKAKTQLIKYLIEGRQKALIKRLPGFRLWEDVMKEREPIIYEWNIVMYKDQLYRLNKNSNNYIWATMRSDYIIDDNNGNYYQGEILRDSSTEELYEFYIPDVPLGYERLGDPLFINTNLSLDNVENEYKFRPNGFGIKNFDRFYRTNEEAKRGSKQFYIDSSETPLTTLTQAMRHLLTTYF